jgi:hypothetical protein
MRVHRPNNRVMDKESERRDKKAPLAPAARCANYAKIGGSE